MRVTVYVYSRPVLDKYFMLLTCPSINKVLLTYLLTYCSGLVTCLMKGSEPHTSP